MRQSYTSMSVNIYEFVNSFSRSCALISMFESTVVPP